MGCHNPDRGRAGVHDHLVPLAGLIALPFECIRCGECCVSLGLVHSITEQCGDFSFLVSNNQTGEENRVTVDPDKRELFLDRCILKKLPDACPFFRHEPGSDAASCTIHHSRPSICRDYQCWRLLIIDHRGRWAGKIPYVRSLVTEDPRLRRLWDACIEHEEEADDRVWEDRMIRILARAGYSVRR